jgi:hypothetical protein
MKSNHHWARRTTGQIGKNEMALTARAKVMPRSDSHRLPKINLKQLLEADREVVLVDVVESEPCQQRIEGVAVCWHETISKVSAARIVLLHAVCCSLAFN